MAVQLLKYMIEITLFNFNKKFNSLNIPTANGVIFECEIKVPSSITNPVIDIRYGNPEIGYSQSLPEFNYAYIPSLKRYYYITNAVWSLGIWTLTLSVDVLASFRIDILNSRQYVARSGNKFNPWLIDSIYPTFRDTDNKIYEQSDYILDVQRKRNDNNTWHTLSNYFDVNINNGAFLVGVIGDGATGVTYYIMPRLTFIEFLHQAFTLSPSNMTDVSQGVAEALFNPLQYITVCRWYPWLPSAFNVGDPTIMSIPIGKMSVDFPNVDNFCYKLDGVCIEEFKFNIDLPQHPQSIENNFDYLNLAPYTETTLYFNPFGCIPIDMTKTIGATRITVHWYVDYPNGIISLEIRNNFNDGLIYTDVAEYGVALPISSLVYDWKAGLLLSGATYIKNQLSPKPAAGPMSDMTDREIAEQYLTDSELSSWSDVQISAYGNLQRQKAGGVSPSSTDMSAGLNSVMDILGSSMGQLATKGAQGSFLQFKMDKPYLFSWFNLIAEPDPMRFGGPCHQIMRLDQLKGFTSVINPYIKFNETNPLVIEQNTIYQLLISGIYIE